jgi:hypothetical protein
MRRGGATIRYGAGRLLVVAAALAAAWSVLTAVSGGIVFHVGPIAVSSRDPVRGLVVAAALLAIARVLLPGGRFGSAVRVLTGHREEMPARTAVATAVCVFIFAIAWNTRAAGGSDSSCYVLQAEAFARGHLVLTDPLSAMLPGATPAMFAPTGFVPSRIVPFAAVPICGPGLALAMAAASVAGRDAVFLIVPACAALAIWLTFELGRRLDDGVSGAAAAVLLATSPIFLYQSVQPMSDVPAAALWLAALVFLSPPAEGSAKAGGGRAQIGAGLCASLAVLMRPNVALIALPLLVLLRDRRGWLRFGLAAAPGLAALAWLNAARYGSPFASGYGGTDVLFTFAHVGPNLARYPRWLLETQTPFVAAAAFAPWWARRHPARARIVLVALGAVMLTAATYLAYTVFDDWWYLRFLLPALPVILVLSVAVTLGVLSWLPPSAFARRSRSIVAAGLSLVIGLYYLRAASTHHVFDLQAMESRFVVAGRYASRVLPADAVVLAVQESGSVRYDGGRSTIAWDAIPPAALDRTIAWLAANGRHPVILLEDLEESRFRGRFPAGGFGALDWPPRGEVNAVVRVRLYDPADRAAYRSGSAVVTEHAR